MSETVKQSKQPSRKISFILSVMSLASFVGMIIFTNTIDVKLVFFCLTPVFSILGIVIGIIELFRRNTKKILTVMGIILSCFSLLVIIYIIHLLSTIFG